MTALSNKALEHTTPHQDLVLRAEKWLKNCGCSVVLRDPFRSSTQERPDAIGWRDGTSLLVEAKVTRADFLKDKNKAFRKNPEQGMGDWRFYLCPPDVITVNDLPKGWGLLYALPKTIRKVHGVPQNTQWVSRMPNNSNKRAENLMVVSALRRLTIRGYLSEVYQGIPGKDDSVND